MSNRHRFNKFIVDEYLRWVAKSVGWLVIAHVLVGTIVAVVTPYRTAGVVVSLVGVGFGGAVVVLLATADRFLFAE